MSKSLLGFAITILMSISSCEIGETPKTIPDFSMTLPDSTKVFHSKDIPFGKTIVVIQFDPNCRDCQLETEEILANIKSYKNTNFYLVTRHPYDDMMVFYDHLRLNTYSNIKIGIDKTGAIPQAYNVRSIPFTLIYNKDKKLKAIISGKPKQADLLEVINKKT